ncbi:MAG: glycosyltransferase [Planctomycetes bacterium]|nr:glycosyltransferase [Planctomycetota bacterium]
MRILLVSHNFPPDATAGTETYTAELGERLLARGHAVEVFTTHKDVGRREHEVVERSWRGLPVHDLVNNLYYRDFRSTWDHPALEPAFQSVLDRFQPELVHFQHLLYLSAGCVERAHARAPVVLTLHDYWLHCPRFGQRVHADGAVCATIDFARCGTCLSTFAFAQTQLARRVGRVIAGVRKTTGVNLAPIARGARGLATGARGAADARPVDAAAEARAAVFAEAARVRAEELRARSLASVDLFLATSRFLRERMLADSKLPPERIEHLPLGVALGAFGARARAPGRAKAAERLRVAFVGTRTPMKGPHLLLEAWAKLPPELRAHAELVVAGPARHEPAYQKRLAELARAAGARLVGRLDRPAVAKLLGETDLLVVPSRWYENSPLGIPEALAARTPLLVSDQGGMAELVQDGVTGFHFRQGDGADLAAKLVHLLGKPDELARLYARAPALTSVREHVDAILERYRGLVARRANRS